MALVTAAHHCCSDRRCLRLDTPQAQRDSMCSHRSVNRR